MDANSFNTLAERVNREYMYRLFGVPLNNSSYGIDFVDHKRKIAIELKGSSTDNLQGEQGCIFKIGVHQIYSYPKTLPGYKFFWAFMPFELKKPISEITEDSIQTTIGKREIWLFDWEYIHAFTAFDDKVYNGNGLGQITAAFRVLGSKNPNPPTAKSKNVTLGNEQMSAFEGLPQTSSKENITIPRNQLYIRPDKKSQIHTPDSVIYCDIRHSEELIEAYRTGPYTIRESAQIKMNFV